MAAKRKPKPKAKAKAKVKHKSISFVVHPKARRELEALGAKNKEIKLVGKVVSAGKIKVGIRKGKQFVPLNRWVFSLEDR